MSPIERTDHISISETKSLCYFIVSEGELFLQNIVFLSMLVGI
jgi:hypothetical protein